MSTSSGKTPASKTTTRKTTDDKLAPPRATPQATRAKPDDASYTDRAVEVAAAVRDASEEIREILRGVTDKVNDLQQNSMPTLSEQRTAGGVRRVPMAVEDVARAVDGLTSAAAELNRRAIKE